MNGNDKNRLPFQWQGQHLHLCDDHQCEDHQWPLHTRRIGHVKQVAITKLGNINYYEKEIKSNQ